MLREVPLKPTGTVTGWSSYVYPATSDYPWLGTGSTTPHEAWATNGSGALAAPSATKHVYCWPSGGDEHCVTFEPGPTLALFTKVTLSTRFDYGQTGPNNWYGNGGTPSLGPGVCLRVRNRAKSAYINHTMVRIGDPGSLAGDLSDWSTNNWRPSKGDTWQLTNWWSWELTSHPEGGPWTLEDINNLAAGVAFIWANGSGDYGHPAYDNSQGSFFKIRVPQMVVTLTVQDLGGYVRSVRHNSSATLRMKRKARNTICNMWARPY
jgi:hypothetical protein